MGLAVPEGFGGHHIVIILAMPWGAVQEALADLGALSGKIVIDCTNPLGMVDGALALTIGHTTSGGEHVAGWLPDARVVKIHNQVGAEFMAENGHLPQRPVMFMAGDDDAAKEAVATLLTDLGFEPMDAGDLTKRAFWNPSPWSGSIRRSFAAWVATGPSQLPKEK